MPDLFVDATGDPSRTMVRQILGSVAEFEKSSLVLKLRGARNRKRAINKAAGIKTLDGKGKVEGRKSYAEKNPDLIREAKRLRRKNPATGKIRSLRTVAELLAADRWKTAKGNIFSPNQIKNLIRYSNE